jgi:hypothetical protein
VFQRSIAGVALALMVTTSLVAADTKLSPQPQGSEVQFITQIQRDLNARFPTAADAEKAGYFRFTNEDSTGAISYANLQWTSADAQHPSQLWYDVNGKLLGADFSQPYVAGQPPSLWGVQPARWQRFRAHVHFIVVAPGGKETYGATSVAKYTAAQGTSSNPAAGIVALGKAPNAAAVSRVFTFPAIWDLIVWVKPNPSGAFADANPLVKPSANAEKADM